MTDGPSLRRVDDQRYQRIERRLIALEKRVEKYEDRVDLRLGKIESKVAFASGAVGIVVIVASILGPVVARAILGV